MRSYKNLELRLCLIQSRSQQQSCAGLWCALLFLANLAGTCFLLPISIAVASAHQNSVPTQIHILQLQTRNSTLPCLCQQFYTPTYQVVASSVAVKLGLKK